MPNKPLPYRNYLDAWRHCIREGLDPLRHIVRHDYSKYEVRRRLRAAKPEGVTA